MGWRRVQAGGAGVLVALAAVIAMSSPALADAQPPIASLPAGSPGSDWRESNDSGPLTKTDIYGSNAKVQGFSAAYRKVWIGSRQVLTVVVERYDSVFWASFRLGQSKGSARANKQHSSYTDRTGYGSAAYETTDPVDAQGFQHDTIVFVDGQYLAVVRLAAQATPSHPFLADYAARQVHALPDPEAANAALGATVIFGAFGVLVVLAVLVLLTVFIARRRTPHVQGAVVGAPLAGPPPAGPPPG